MDIVSCKAETGAYLALTLEDGQTYRIHREIAAQYDLSGRLTIDPDTLEQLLLDNDTRRAYQRALYLLDGQDYSFQMLFRKLERNYEEAVCYAVMERLTGQGLINDWKYAKQIARRAAEGKHNGPLRIRQILRQKGIPARVVDQTLLPYQEEAEQLPHLAYLLEHKYGRYLEDPTQRKQIEKCKAALARMGYGYGVIQKAVRLYWEAENE
jgi:regulatory protein